MAKEDMAVAQIFIRPPIYDNLFSYVEPCALTRMSSVSGDVRIAVKDFERRAYNVNKHLARFFSDPLSFRSLMAKTRMVISGSFALQFFDRTRYPGSDLDLYAYRDDGVHEIGKFLLAEGYVFQRSWSQEWDDFHQEVDRILDDIDQYNAVEDLDEYESDYGSRLIMSGVYTFKHWTSDGLDASCREIQLIVSRKSPFPIILNFHSSEYDTFVIGIAEHPRTSLRHECHHV